MFALLVQYNKLVSVLTGAPTPQVAIAYLLAHVSCVRSWLGPSPQAHPRRVALWNRYAISVI